MPSILGLTASALLAIIVYKAVSLARNVRLAKATGLPYVITPVLETEVIGFLATPILRWIYDRRLESGCGWPRWCRFIIKDWSWEDKRLAHDEYGDVFLCVSPEGIICYTADADMGWDVMNRRNDFSKPRDKYKILEPYGPNVATAEGATYRYHVRITAPPFGDMSGVNNLVWDETIFQTRRLSRLWAKNAPQDLDMDVNGLTLAVISRAGFGKTIHHDDEGPEQKHSAEPIPSGYKISFLAAIHGTTANMVPILLLPGWLLRLTPLRSAAIAHLQLGKYLREMIATERSELRKNENHQSSVARGNLLTAVMRASFSEGRTSAAASRTRKEAFSDDEVLGNLFIYLLAGYETTANAISYGLACLALHPDIQENVIREINDVHSAAREDGYSELSYAKHFEKLEYLYGFMYEVFRLYPGVTLITKVALQPQTITVTHGPPSTSTMAMPTTTKHTLPAGTRVYLSAPAVHYHPRYWPEPTKLDPYRWIGNKWAYSDTAALQQQRQQEVSQKPRSAPVPQSSPQVTAAPRPPGMVAADRTRHMRGTLLTFSDGARSCLGRKFAQAEFMAFFVALLREYRVTLGQGLDPAVVKRDLDLKSAGKITLAPPYGLQLVLKRRGAVEA